MQSEGDYSGVMPLHTFGEIHEPAQTRMRAEMNYPSPFFEGEGRQGVFRRFPLPLPPPQKGRGDPKERTSKRSLFKGGAL